MKKGNLSENLNRLIWILEKLLNVGDRGLSKSAVDQMFIHSSLCEDGHPFTNPTWTRHLNDLSEVFGVKISHYFIGHEKYFYIDSTPSKEQDRLRSLLLSELRTGFLLKENSSINDHIVIDEVPYFGEGLLSTILLSIRERKILKISYKSFKPGSVERVFQLAPYVVVKNQMRWYVYGYNTVRESAIMLSLDRMLKCEIGESSFDMDKVADYFNGKLPGELFTDYLGLDINDETKVEDIHIKVYSQRYIGYVRSTPLHHSQHEILGSYKPYTWVDHSNNVLAMRDDSTCEFTLHIHPTIDFLRKLLSFGPFLEVLGPASVISQVKSLLNDACSMYSK